MKMEVEVQFEQIAQNRLVAGKWYVGRGRNANVGLWNGEYQTRRLVLEAWDRINPGVR